MYIASVDPSIRSTGVYRMKLHDKTLDILEQDYLGFTSVKKNESGKILHYKKNQFKDDIDRNIFFQENILDFIKECEFSAIEDYAYNATGMIFNIAEFVGSLKQVIYKHSIKIRMYDPPTVKMYATGKGNCDKIRMIDEYDKLNEPKSDFSTLPQYKSPKEDLVDAFFLCKLLRLELLLRKGLVAFNSLTEVELKIMNRCTKANPINLLARDFIGD